MPSNPDTALPRELVAAVFRSLRGRFGNAFIDKFRTGRTVPDGQPHAGKDTGLLEAMDVWAYELRHLSQADIRHGLASRFKYPPSADEFITACCNRDYSTHPANALPALTLAPPDALERELAAKHLATVAGTVKRLAMPPSRLRIDWAERIARQVATGHYKGGHYGARLAAEALLAARQPIPPALVPYLPVPANDHDDGAAA